jgi:prepilin-type N-terminal cleavage/methylation domain-containing protein
MRGSGRQNGFTLIELLIVVAIIAILAAIAVPNFLEAQVRAKVSRVKADQRSLGLALECYALDNNGKYPKALLPEFLTTPIAYMSALPKDAFLGDDKRQITRNTFLYVTLQKPAGGWRAENLYKDYYASNWPYLYPRPALIPDYLGQPTAMWELKSTGPNRNSNRSNNPGASITGANPNNPGDDFSMAYDPTNGIVSNGDICRYGP